MTSRGVAPGLLAVLLLAQGCAPPTRTDRIASWRQESVSRATWERVRPLIQALQPGDDLRIFARAREFHTLRLRSGERPVVVMPAWITSLSGGAAGGASLVGQLVSRNEDQIFGSHVFGYVAGGRIVPRYQLLTTATVVDPAEFARLVRDETPDIGVLPRPSGLIHFRDLMVAGGRPLEFDDGRRSGEGDPLDPSALLSESAYRSVAPVLDSMPPGTDLFSMLWLLGAEFVTRDFGETHSLRVAGFLNTQETRTVTLERPDGVFKLRPFGWVQEGEGDVVRRIAVFRNDRLRGVVPFAGFADAQQYLDATAPTQSAPGS